MPTQNTAGLDRRGLARLTAAGVLLAAAASLIAIGPAHSATADNQTVSTHMNHSRAITLQGTGFGTLTFEIKSQPSHGVLTRDDPQDAANPHYTYAPDNGFAGTDSFT